MLPKRTIQYSVEFWERQLAFLKEGLETLTDEYAISRQEEEIAVVEIRLKFARERLERAKEE